MHPIAYAFLGATWSAGMAYCFGTPTKLTVGLLFSAMVAFWVLGV